MFDLASAIVKMSAQKQNERSGWILLHQVWYSIDDEGAPSHSQTSSGCINEVGEWAQMGLQLVSWMQSQAGKIITIWYTHCLDRYFSSL